MIQDEFNNISVNNDKEFSKIEYGKVQKTEYSENGDMSLRGNNHKVNLDEATKQINTVAESGTVTTVSSSATASSIATATTSVAVVASAVTITAISVVTGISVALHDYQYEFETFIISANELSYDLYIKDLKIDDDSELYNYDYEQFYREDKDPNEEAEIDEERKRELFPLTLRVYNDTYDSYRELHLGSNYGLFQDLTLGETYKIALSESRYGGETLFEEKFTTVANSTFSDFYLESGVDYYNNTAYAIFDFVDDNNQYSDFVLSLSSETHSLEIALDKQSGPQEIKLPGKDEGRVELNALYNYSFSYVENNEKVVFKEGEVSFYDLYSEFHEFIFDKTADFKDGSFKVRLDYYDERKVAFDNFILTFFFDGEEEYGTEIELEPSVEEQTIYAETYDIMLSSFETYNYKLTCTYYDIPLELDRGEVTFSDNSGAVDAIEFRDINIFEAANFDTREVSYQLDFTDELYYLYGFELTIKDLETENTKTIYPDHTTEVQTFLLDETDGLDEDKNPIYLIDIKQDPIVYSFKFSNLDQEIEFATDKEISFVNSLVSVFTDIESTFDFINETGDSAAMLPIKLVYDDAAHEYDYFNVDVAVNDAHIAYLSFEGDNVKHDWQYCVWYPDDGTTTVDTVIGTNDEVKIRVSTMAPETPEHPYAEEVIIYEEIVTFTKNTSTEDILGVYLQSNVIVNGSYDIGFYPVYTGGPDNFECQIIFETNTGKTYTCNYFLPSKGSYSYAILLEAEESFDEESFMTDFESGVKITLKYCTLTYEGGDSASGGDPIKSDYITKVLYENFVFEISV